VDARADQKIAEEAAARPQYKVACPKCSAALTAPAGDSIKCPKCSFIMKVTPPVAPKVAVGSTVSSTAVRSTAGEIERLAGLHAQGVLSDAEFVAAKSKVLG
jgi:DNA-directed RNA polymerase subunit RPC12/RpoP